ncbi:thioredoxin-like protein [Lipomyces arxii]|uniref:thioredoxin-like protein n=1 Tax=Lipomyces arxii TaxID=56418 RepID=UPI0034CD5B53
MSSVAMRVPPKSIKFYCSVICPWAARTWIALTQANVEFEYIEIDLANKPAWFLKEVNPGGKVPTLKYGDDILIESAITTEFVADLFPEAGLISTDAFERAEGRLMADRYMELLFPLYRDTVFKADSTAVGKTFEAIDKFLPFLKNANPFFGGATSITLHEIMIAPFIARYFTLLESDFVDASIYKTLSTDPKYSYFFTWASNILSSPGLVGTYDKKLNFGIIEQRLAPK